jgi:hypothetical protein
MRINAFARPDRAGGLATFDASRATPRDMLLIALAGPAASLVGFVVAAWAMSGAPHGLLRDLLWAATGDSAFAVLNLVPLTLSERRGGSALRTDGRIALDALRVERFARGRPDTRSRRAVNPAVATQPASRSKPPAGHHPLRGQRGAPLGVAPLPRAGDRERADDEMVRRARGLAANESRSIPPPGR